MIKQSDCNSCQDRNCRIYTNIRFDCKAYKPCNQPLAKLAEVVLSNNPQGLHDCLKKCKLTLPKSLS
jgi:hypothetical protein